MSGYPSRFDNQPLNFWNGNPIYLTAYLTLGLVGGLALSIGLTALVPVSYLLFSPPNFLSGMLWQVVSYIFVDSDIGILTLLNLYCFYAWGMEVEKYLGRRRYLSLIAVLIIAPALFFLAAHLLGMTTYLYGLYFLDAGILVCFAALYPDMGYFFGWIPLKWFAIGLTAWGALVFLSHHDWLHLGALGLNCGLAFVLTRHGVDWLEFRPRVPAFLKPKPKFRVLPKPAPRAVVAAAYAAAPVSEEEIEVDSLLDKIARSGLQSLTAAERERLEKARQAMLRKDR